MILVIDNYDSFTWNLVELVKRSGAEVLVKQNDQITISEIEKMNPHGILLSPGPGRPQDSGICVQVVKQFAGHISMLGICLGHQLIGESFGAEVVKAETPMHGKTTLIHHHGRGLFAGIPNPFRAMRYHSLLLRDPLPAGPLNLSAWTEKGEIMGISHSTDSLEGLQFHPESILTDFGTQIMNNWVHSLTELERSI